MANHSDYYLVVTMYVFCVPGVVLNSYVNYLIHSWQPPLEVGREAHTWRTSSLLWIRGWQGLEACSMMVWWSAGYMALQQRVYQMRVCRETASAAKSPESETLGVELGVAVQVCHPSPWELRQDYRNGCEAILGDTVRRANNPQGSRNSGTPRLSTLVSIFLAGMLSCYCSTNTQSSL